MRIALVTPAGAGSRAGNRHTALRWAAMLRAAGHRVTVGTVWRPQDPAHLMLALHARRSHASIKAFAQAHPGRPLVLALTGTDVYRDIRNSREAQESMQLADRFITLQRLAAREMAPVLRRKVTVVVQSSSTQRRHRPVARGFRATVIGHLREEKDSLRSLAALRLLPERAGFQLIQLGEALDATLARQAKAAMRRDARYRWLGSVPHATALRWLASSHVLVVSSRMEGGANVVSEALRIGVPVLASRIPGNVGLLGAGYPGYYPTGDEAALAALLTRAQADPGFYRRLLHWMRKLRPMVAPRNEAAALRAAISFPGRAAA
ncbi:MAG: selenoneine biosynthesis selenosugar synthase SenB [Proteobacteria bacterium]|nr:selenoneine biosynthesis selenosugar synthase SenB [Pseudomonadota bacterium]